MVRAASTWPRPSVCCGPPCRLPRRQPRPSWSSGSTVCGPTAFPTFPTRLGRRPTSTGLGWTRTARSSVKGRQGVRAADRRAGGPTAGVRRETLVSGRPKAFSRVPMAELTARRVAAIAAVAGALVGGGGRRGGRAVRQRHQQPGHVIWRQQRSVATAVVRTTCTTVQVGGSIGYDGSYTITALGGGGAAYTWLPRSGRVIRQDQRRLLGQQRAGAAAVRLHRRLPGLLRRHVRRRRCRRADAGSDRAGRRRRAAPRATTTRRRPPARSSAGSGHSVCP